MSQKTPQQFEVVTVADELPAFLMRAIRMYETIHGGPKVVWTSAKLEALRDLIAAARKLQEPERAAVIVPDPPACCPTPAVEDGLCANCGQWASKLD
jgi:hypothetical protein